MIKKFWIFLIFNVSPKKLEPHSGISAYKNMQSHILLRICIFSYTIILVCIFFYAVAYFIMLVHILICSINKKL
jgi:hypothetical protein